MIFEKLLMPDEVYSSFEELTPEHMKELGKMYPPENVKEWCAHMAENGIKVAFVSNNNLERVEKFNSHFGYDAYSKAGKPKRSRSREPSGQPTRWKKWNRKPDSWEFSPPKTRTSVL